MLPLSLLTSISELYTWPRGAALMRRGASLSHIDYVRSGVVTLQVREDAGAVRHMGWVQGPCWLNAGCAVLGVVPLVDAVADTAVQTQRVPLSVFEAEMRALPATAQSVLRDVALAHQQQTEMAVSRLAKDAEARCAEWLLRHAEPASDASPALTVRLHERKRIIATHLGIAPETLSRVLRQLRERSLISGSGRVLRLVDLPALRALAGC